MPKQPVKKTRKQREPAPAASQTTPTGGGDLGFEDKLFQAADKLRNNMDAAEYKHVVLGLIFLKYINDAFEEVHWRRSRESAAERSR